MIYKKEANFPYPVLSPYSSDYPENEFTLDINLDDKGDDYGFEIIHKMDSVFISNLLRYNKAIIYLVIESRDVLFFELKDTYITIPKNRISLNKRSSFQLFIAATQRFTFSNNDDIDEFFHSMRRRIVLEKGKVLAFSNVVRFNGDLKKPYELFEYSIKPNLESDINIILMDEVIHIQYKNKELRYTGIPGQSRLNYHYIYMGLQKALMKFLFEQGEETINIEDTDETSTNLSFKLLNLLKLKSVDSLSFKKIDSVVYKISDNIIEKHCEAIKGLRE